MTTGGSVLTAATVNALNTRVAAQETLQAASLQGDSIYAGNALITPVASTVTSLAVTGLSIGGSSFRAMVLAATTLPSTAVVEVGFGGQSATGITLYIYRTDTTGTNVNYLIIGT